MLQEQGSNYMPMAMLMVDLASAYMHVAYLSEQY